MKHLKEIKIDTHAAFVHEYLPGINVYFTLREDGRYEINARGGDGSGIDPSILSTLIAEVEENDHASKDRPIGSALIYNDTLYLVTDEIAEGDEITEGTNVEAYNMSTLWRLSHKQYLHTFPLTGWALQSGGTWDGWYKNTIEVSAIFNQSAHVRASGATLETPASDAMKQAVYDMEFDPDASALTVTAYAKSEPVEDILVSIEGVAP